MASSVFPRALERIKMLKDLRKKVGAYAVLRLRKGKAKLVCYRGTTPYNWWIESENGRGSFLWHSKGAGDRPDLSLFDRVEDSEEKIASSFLHGDGGRPFLSTYVLKSEYR